MSFTLIAICVLVACLLIAIWIKLTRDKRQMEKHTITPEALRNLVDSNQEVLLFDVRQPLDLLADSQIIPGSTRIPPKDVLRDPTLIPKDKDAVVYCTCPGEETSRRVLQQALAMHFSRIKILKGGLASWKAKGYPVVPYGESFHLDTRT
jgi:rhodanese-related sulfurtransferase